jgi:hypothetical protein
VRGGGADGFAESYIRALTSANFPPGSKIPNLIAGIGVEFEQIGDVLYEEGQNGGDNVAYIVCAPAVRKTIERLLPKSLGRSTIEATDAGFEPTGSLVELVVARVDGRK